MPTEPEKKGTSIGRRRLIIAIKFGLVAGLIWAIIHFGWLDLSELTSVAGKPFHLALAAALMLVALLLTALRWRMLLAVQGVRPAAWEVIRLSFIGFFFSNVIPGGVSGDAVKAYYVVREHGKTPRAITSVLVDRFIGLYTLVLTASATVAVCRLSGSLSEVFARPRVLMLCWIMIGLAAGMTLFSGAMLSRRAKESRAFNRLLDRLPFHKYISKLHDAILLYRDNKGTLACALALSAAAQIPMVLVILLVGKALGDGGLSIGAYFFLAPVGLVINVIPISPGGVGTTEGALEFLFGAFGSTIGAEAAALWHVLFFGWSLIGMVLYIKGKKAYDAAAKETNALGEIGCGS